MTRDRDILRARRYDFQAEPIILSDPEYLRDLAERLMRIPVMYGTDQSDVSRLYDIADKLKNAPRR